jgi:8-oxo-dGTP pyrophosphatase MutT (NUDIX family)
MTAHDRSSAGERRLVAASVALVLWDDRTLVLRRRPDERSFAHRWCLPGGRIEPGESPLEAAVRETAEETGLRVAVHDALGPRVVSLHDRPIDFEIHRFVARAAHDRVLLSEEHVAARWLTRVEAARAHDLLPSGLAGEVTTELLAHFARGG